MFERVINVGAGFFKVSLNEAFQRIVKENDPLDRVQIIKLDAGVHIAGNQHNPQKIIITRPTKLVGVEDDVTIRGHFYVKEDASLEIENITLTDLHADNNIIYAENNTIVELTKCQINHRQPENKYAVVSTGEKVILDHVIDTSEHGCSFENKYTGITDSVFNELQFKKQNQTIMKNNLIKGYMQIENEARVWSEGVLTFDGEIGYKYDFIVLNEGYASFEMLSYEENTNLSVLLENEGALELADIDLKNPDIQIQVNYYDSNELDIASKVAEVVTWNNLDHPQINLKSGFNDLTLDKVLKDYQAGTIINLEPGIYSQPNAIIKIEKDLEIHGLGQDATDTKIFLGFEIAPGVKFTLDNLTVFNEYERTVLYADEKTDVTLKNCTFETAQTLNEYYSDGKEGAQYYRLYFTGAESAVLDNVMIATEESQFVCFVDCPQVRIHHGIYDGIVIKAHTNVRAEATYIMKHLTLADNSNFRVGNLTLDQVTTPIEVCEHSQLIIEDLELLTMQNAKTIFNAKDGYIQVDKLTAEQLGAIDFEYDSQSTIVLSEDLKQLPTVKMINTDLENLVKSYQTADNSVVNNQEDPLQKLNNLYGLKAVKEKTRGFLNSVKFNETRKKQGLPANNITLHSVFIGNPGTGKTTVARLMGEVLADGGALENANLIEVGREDLVGKYLGETEEKTKAILEKAQGGILFIDEAYTLSEGGDNDYGQIAIDTILKYMEDHRDQIMLIFAGYPDEMNQFLQSNPGLKSRVPNVFNFEDYSLEELTKIGLMQLQKDKYQVDHELYQQFLKQQSRKEITKSNARFVRNMNEALITALASRVMANGLLDAASLTTITPEDLETVKQSQGADQGESIEDILNQLDKLIGLATVKEYIKDLVGEVQAEKRLAEVNPDLAGDRTYHMVFSGNPGTGKTTVARLLAKLFFKLGILTQTTVKEVTRPDLIGQYIGETEQKTQTILDNALGGVLFIDEAYQLASNGSSNDFGKQAIETLLTALENHRHDFVVILAGYTQEMEEFLNTNPGLRSRIPNRIEFPDYTPNEIGVITAKMLNSKKFVIADADFEEKIAQAYLKLPKQDWGNARTARNFAEKIIKEHKLWIIDHSTVDDILTIRSETIDEALKEL
ncbi:AAA family ATPase [Ligilactobacillus ceti]|uniref:Stage V sporulation protein K n=1 Tax=Ligilactobacillus ceti DSM 22408 TaxID=1122146 RepID=A0A0R2KNN0_9LACO|nr:AAA family ATPase [Ligilactobacillus ceti]KRN88636.1 stage V sporulation protein K [Ligilactobacillus ceti DSM 22408]